MLVRINLPFGSHAYRLYCVLVLLIHTIALDTKLADRTASSVVETPDTPGTATQQSITPPPVADPRQQAPRVQGPSPQDILSTTRTDLAEAQRSRTELQERLARATTELERLRKRNTHDAKRITSMEGEIANLQLRLRDRDEELKGKAKLLEVCLAKLMILGNSLTPVVSRNFKTN